MIKNKNTKLGPLLNLYNGIISLTKKLGPQMWGHFLNLGPLFWQFLRKKECAPPPPHFLQTN